MQKARFIEPGFFYAVVGVLVQTYFLVMSLKGNVAFFNKDLRALNSTSGRGRDVAAKEKL